MKRRTEKKQLARDYQRFLRFFAKDRDYAVRPGPAAQLLAAASRVTYGYVVTPDYATAMTKVVETPVDYVEIPLESEELRAALVEEFGPELRAGHEDYALRLDADLARDDAALDFVEEDTKCPECGGLGGGLYQGPCDACGGWGYASS